MTGPSREIMRSVRAAPEDKSWQPECERIPDHDPEAERCDCTECLVNRLRDDIMTRQTVRQIRDIEHDLDPDCHCDDCDEVRQITDQYKDNDGDH